VPEGSGNNDGSAVTLAFYVPQSSLYYFWARTRAPSWNSYKQKISLDGSPTWDWLFPNVGGGWSWARMTDDAAHNYGPLARDLSRGWHELRITNAHDGAMVDAIALVQGWDCTPVSAGCPGASKAPGLAAPARFISAVPQATPPAVTRFAHGEYFESDPGWETAGGEATVVDSAYRLEAWYASDAAVAVAPWAMTFGHLRARAMAVPNGERPQTARLLFDYQDVNNYKSAGLRADAGQQKWVLKVVQDGVESDLVTPVADATLRPDHWYQLDLVVGLSQVTLYADGQEKISWTRGSGQRLTGGRVGLATRGGSAAFQELEVWDVTEVTKHYAIGGQRVALRRSGVLYYVHTDHLGSISVLTDKNGAEVPGTWLKYYPYGAPRPADQAGTHNAFATGYTEATFTGQRRDVGTGLYHYGARYYDSTIGRFIQPDTIVPQPGNPQSLNRYSYVLNNPLRYTDPTGRWGADVHWLLTGDLTYNVGRQVASYAGAASPLSVDLEAGAMAHIVAAANLGVDLEGAARFAKDWVEMGDYSTARTRGWSQTVDPALGTIPEQYYHYATQGEAEARLQEAITAKDPVAFGRALHSYQDYFAHTLQGFSAQSGQAGIDAMMARCPSCQKRMGDLESAKRASGLGHDADEYKGIDRFNPKDWYSMATMQGSEWYILLFLLNYYGIDVDQFLTDTGYTPPSDPQIYNGGG
jgi:RHS repeat-associated protein